MGGNPSKQDGVVNNNVYVENKLKISNEVMIIIYVICGLMAAMFLFKMYQTWYRGLKKKVTRSNAVDQA